MCFLKTLREVQVLGGTAEGMLEGIPAGIVGDTAVGMPQDSQSGHQGGGSGGHQHM